MDYTCELDETPLYYVDDINSDDERSDPELYSSSSATSSSIDTLASSEVHDYFQEAHGRKFPADANIAISLPTDSIEVQRCAEQHRILKAFLGSNYWGPVDQALTTAPGHNGRKKVLDMVTAEGSWAQEMSLQFPHVDFLSLDNVPLTPHMPHPNVEFEVYDLYNGIAAPDETFDVAHMRFTMMHLTNPQDIIRDIHRVLRPGGLFLFANTELSVFDALNPERAMNEVLPSLSEGFKIMRAALSQQGVKIHMGREVSSWLAPDSDMWMPIQAKEPGKPVGFRDIEYKQHLVPAGTWPEDTWMKVIGRDVGWVWGQIWRSMEAPLQLFGLDEANAKRVVRGAVEDINRPGVAIAAKFHMVYAFKI
ncbi:hypothetical protein FS749_016559 [Ceratobasidium sp. UAMH 11750]|nr:hypothetical protein FS749_016559 [Ceratobasidium sp. UAMH 11750]